MKASVFLRIAAVVTAVFDAAHMLGRPWTRRHDVQTAAVIEAMKSYRFNAMGFERSYFDFYVGFGWTLAVYLVMQAVLLWQLAGFAKT
jgi:hypothetical protein